MSTGTGRKKLRAAMVLLCAAVAAGPGFATQIAHLRNGFTIAHQSHERRGTQVRLYLNAAKTNFVDVPAIQIVSYSLQPAEPALQPVSHASAAAQPAESTNQIVREAGRRQGVDSDFLRSVIRQESAGNPRAVSPAGARGLMQLMPSTAADLGVDDSFDPEQNVRGGARYLRQLLERYHGDAIKALAAYNAGPEAVDRYHGVPPYPETRQYVRRVVRDYNREKRAELSADKNQDHSRSGVRAASGKP